MCITVYTSDVCYCINLLLRVHTKITELYKCTRRLYKPANYTNSRII